ncbi:MAG: hypothetical protein M1831_004770 [Alyxoria varia]|nr:MAG: hypothetical protein M1831_004770 [Alyxoria varia]
MPPTLYHLQHSQSERVLFLLEELNIHYTLKTYPRDPETAAAPPIFRSLHVPGTAPVLTDDSEDMRSAVRAGGVQQLAGAGGNGMDGGGVRGDVGSMGGNGGAVVGSSGSGDAGEGTGVVKTEDQAQPGDGGIYDTPTPASEQIRTPASARIPFTHTQTQTQSQQPSGPSSSATMSGVPVRENPSRSTANARSRVNQPPAPPPPADPSATSSGQPLHPAPKKAAHVAGAPNTNTDILLGESMSCIDYLIHTYGGHRPDLTIHPGQPNYPAYLQWLHQANGSLTPLESTNLLLKLLGHSPASGGVPGVMRQRLDAMIGMYDKRLSECTYLAGERFTLADVVSVFGLSTFRGFLPEEMDLSGYPNVLRWLDLVGQRPSYQKAFLKGHPGGEEPLLDAKVEGFGFGFAELGVMKSEE